MFAANTYLIRLATDDDAGSLRRLSEFDGRGALSGPVLIGHLNGRPAAAISVANGQIVIDPASRADHLVACLRVRASALRAFHATPSLANRMLKALSATDQGCSIRDLEPPRRRSAKARATANSRGRRRHARTRVPCVA
jgi:hypothetical protein